MKTFSESISLKSFSNIHGSIYIIMQQTVSRKLHYFIMPFDLARFWLPKEKKKAKRWGTVSVEGLLTLDLKSPRQ